MIGRKSRKSSEEAKQEALRGFDDFDLRLGDILRGERATMGKSLLDVQRELRIKASYIAAIENCDPSAFDTPGFIAGYVRSYARYLGMDPEDTFAVFCAESGFQTAHGMSDAASSRKSGEPIVAAPKTPAARDPFTQPKLPFTPGAESVLARIEPAAIGSTFILLALLVGLGYGGWSVLQEVQRVQVAPVDQTPVVLADLDPLQTVVQPTQPNQPDASEQADLGAGVFTPPQNKALDRLYRPQALDVPVLVARDAPISTLDPSTVGVFAQAAQKTLPTVDLEPQERADALRLASTAPTEAITLVAARPTWVRVRGADRSVIFERVMNAGETWQVPTDQAGATLNVGESGALYVAVNGKTVGPMGPDGTVTSDLPLVADALLTRYAEADLGQDDTLNMVLAELGAIDAGPAPGQPKILEDSAPGVLMVAVRPAWVRVRAADGSVIYEATMQAGDTYRVPAMEEPPTLRVGESGAVYFAINGQTYGPVGRSGQVTSKLALSVDNLVGKYQVAELDSDTDLKRVVAELNTTLSAQGGN